MWRYSTWFPESAIAVLAIGVWVEAGRVYIAYETEIEAFFIGLEC